VILHNHSAYLFKEAMATSRCGPTASSTPHPEARFAAEADWNRVRKNGSHLPQGYSRQVPRGPLKQRILQGVGGVYLAPAVVRWTKFDPRLAMNRSPFCESTY